VSSPHSDEFELEHDESRDHVLPPLLIDGE
jgi:hypothetical protein